MSDPTPVPGWLSRAMDVLIQSGTEESVEKAFEFAKAGLPPYAVRFTGMSGFGDQEYRLMLPTLGEVFKQRRGAYLFGGTEIRSLVPPHDVIPTVMTVPLWAKESCVDDPTLALFAIVPRIDRLRYTQEFGNIILVEPEHGYFTRMAPHQALAVLLQTDPDNPSDWSAEWRECLGILERLRRRRWNSLLVSFNGGGETANEIKAHAKLGWPVLLIEDSGRKTQEIAEDSEFRSKFPNVHSAPCDVDSINAKLDELGVPRKG